MAMERELFIIQAANSSLMFLTCDSCEWKISLQPISGSTRDQEAELAFVQHNCADYPKTSCDENRTSATEAPFIADL